MRGFATGGRAAAKKLVTGGLVCRASAFVWAMGEITLLSLREQQTKMQLEIVRHFQEKRLSELQYQRAMRQEIPQPSQYLLPIR